MVNEYSKGSITDDYFKKFKADYAKKPSTGFSTDMFGDIFGDENMMGNITGLAGTFMQSLAMPSQLTAANLSNEAKRTNIDTINRENAQRGTNITTFNNNRGGSSNPSGGVSAFADINSNKSSLV
jgi:hypothetical protein